VASSLVEQYIRQARWRRWDEALDLLPLERGERVLDIGCGVGDVAARLDGRGVDVLGIDSNVELLAAARARHPHVRFEEADVRDLASTRLGLFDGLWVSFVTAYFPDLVPVLTRWSDLLRPGGWLAMVEVDDLLGHEPLSATLRADVVRFYDEARSAGRYDFEGGRKLASAARAVGLQVTHEEVLVDDELGFGGAAPADVLEAWSSRLARMGALRAFMGDRFSEFEQAFVAALRSESHRSRARVIFVLAKRVPVSR
jgi:trans-aconitate methyltransferase